MALADLIVVEVVRRGDFHAAGTEGLVDVFVGNDRNRAAGQRQYYLTADQTAVAFVFRMHGNGCIAKHGFRAGGGNCQMTAAVGEWVTDLPQLAVFLLGLYFEVGNDGAQYRVPVGEAHAAIDQAVAVEFDEGVGDQLRQRFIHRETLAVPVAGGTEAAHLPRDGRARLFFPIPDPFDEFVASQGVA